MADGDAGPPRTSPTGVGGVAAPGLDLQSATPAPREGGSHRPGGLQKHLSTVVQAIQQAYPQHEVALWATTNTASGSCPSCAGSGVRAGSARQRLCSSATSGAISMPLCNGGRDAPGGCCFLPCPAWCVCLPSPSLPMPLVQDEANSSSACWIAPGGMWAARCRCPQGPIGTLCLRTRPSCSPPNGCGRRPMRPWLIGMSTTCTTSKRSGHKAVSNYTRGRKPSKPPRTFTGGRNRHEQTSSTRIWYKLQTDPHTHSLVVS
jgi:hypothetical protein